MTLLIFHALVAHLVPHFELNVSAEKLQGGSNLIELMSPPPLYVTESFLNDYYPDNPIAPTKLTPWNSADYTVFPSPIQMMF